MRKRQVPVGTSRARTELQRILGVLDQAAVTGNLSRLAQAFCGAALAEIQGRFAAYQMAGIQVHPQRESVQVEVESLAAQGPAVLRLRYRDRTRFVTPEGQAQGAADPVLLRVTLDRSREPWRVSSISEE